MQEAEVSIIDVQGQFVLQKFNSIWQAFLERPRDPHKASEITDGGESLQENQMLSAENLENLTRETKRHAPSTRGNVMKWWKGE